jgi:anaerobic magnesium-protoporphyrin IX monomethyl ester cyclase
LTRFIFCVKLNTSLTPITEDIATSTMTNTRLDAAFINPSFGYPIIKEKGLFYTKMWPPLSLAYCAAIMEEHGLKVAIVDAQAERLSPGQAADRASAAGQVFVNSSPLDRWQCPVNEIKNVYAVIQSLKAGRPERKVLLIGAHGTTFPEKILKEIPVDAVILGEPEITVKELSQGRPIEGIEGMAYRRNGQVVVREKRKYLSLNEFPKPAFHLLPMKKYYFEFLGKNFAMLEGSRGCPYACTFCYKDMYGPYRIKTSKKLIGEIEYAVEEFGVRNIYFADLTFTVNKKQVLDVCDFIIGRRYDLHWACQTRFDLVDEPILKKMKEAGCRLIQFGVESGTEEIVRKTNKYIPPKTISEGLRLVHKLGIESVAFIMFGLPNETAEDMVRSIQYVKKINPTYVAYNISIPYTEATYDAQRASPANEGVFFSETYGGFSKDFLDAMVKKLMIAFYLSPRTIPKVLKNPKSIIQKIRLFLAAL